MAFPESFLQELAERNDIVDVVGSYVRLTKKSGSNLFGLCPFHSEKTPSFSVSPDKQIYHCFGCGKGGSVIQKIVAESGAKIDIDDDGNVFICGLDLDKANACVQVISTIVNPPEVGAIYKGKVVRIMNFGAFVEIAPGKDGMVHISKLDNHRVEKVEDVVSVGDEIIVKVMEIDNQGRINLSRKDALADIEAKRKAQAQG